MNQRWGKQNRTTSTVLMGCAGSVCERAGRRAGEPAGRQAGCTHARIHAYTLHSPHGLCGSYGSHTTSSVGSLWAQSC